MRYTIQVSNHPGAWERIPSADASASWRTQYDGEIASAREARVCVDQLSAFYRHVRAFRGASIGRAFYAVLRAPAAAMPDRTSLAWVNGGAL